MLCCWEKMRIACIIFSIWNNTKGVVITMRRGRKYRYVAAFLLLGMMAFILFAMNICIGSVRITWSDLVETLTGHVNHETIARILFDIRLPRTLAAMILGGALALSGYLLQSFFHNPIAGPFVLGISSGVSYLHILQAFYF